MRSILLVVLISRCWNGYVRCSSGQYDRLAHTALFQYGLKRILRGLKDGFRVALVCAEKEPLDCHRTILVARHLAALGIPVAHIHAGGHLETHDAALDRLARMLNVPERDMFRSHDELLAEVYRLQEERIAYEIVAPAQDTTQREATR